MRMNLTGGNDLIGAGDGTVLDREEEWVRHFCQVLSKPRGRDPLCYRSDVTGRMIDAYLR